MKKKIVIAGATGFIGRWIIEKFKNDYEIVALSRKVDKDQEIDNVLWKKVDLYSISSTERALKGADYAIYLVHSMQPSTRLNQGEFQDTDLLLADNFSRGARKNNLKQIVTAYKISKHTLKTIKQNLFWAFSYNILAIPIAALGFLNPMWGALFMAFSDVIVIGNSLRLKKKNINS